MNMKIFRLCCIILIFSMLVACNGFSEGFQEGFEDAVSDSGSVESEVTEPQSEAEENASDSTYQDGKELGKSLVDEMNSIDWEENKEKAEEAGKEAAEFLNKLFSEE